MKRITVVLIMLAATAAWAQSGARSADVERVETAATVLSQIMGAPDAAIPDTIMDGAKCLAIVPSMLKASFLFGANYGKGVATCRTTTGWSAPVFFKVEGGSFGFQAGGQAADLVLVVRTMDGMQHLLQSKFKLGADASAAAGPVGRDAEAATDLTMRAQILTYSRSRGLFLGVSVNGAVVHQDNNATASFYGKDWTFYSLLNGEVPPPADAQNFLKTVEFYAPTRRAATHHSDPAPLAAPTPTAAPEAVPAAEPAPAAPVEPSAAVAPPAKVTAPAAPSNPGSPGDNL